MRYVLLLPLFMFFVFAVDSCGVIGNETAENERMVDSINDLWVQIQFA